MHLSKGFLSHVAALVEGDCLVQAGLQGGVVLHQLFALNGPALLYAGCLPVFLAQWNGTLQRYNQLVTW